jgi:hypothetical protein
VLLGSFGVGEEAANLDNGFGPLPGPDGWICDHPWAAEWIRQRLPDGSPVSVVLTAAAVSSFLTLGSHPGS